MDKNRNGYGVVIVTGIITMIILAWNIMTPTFADDFTYLFSQSDGSRMNSIFQIPESMYKYYFSWGGRVSAHTLVQIFLVFGNTIFDILNTIVFIALAFLIYNCSFQDQNIKPIKLLLVFGGMFLVIPSFGQTCLWLTGSCNYLWGAFFNLIWISSFKKCLFNNKILTKWQMIVLIPFAFIAGSYNENSSPAFIIVAILCMLIMKVYRRKIPIFMYVHTISAMVGFLWMIVAPGNQIRANGEQLTLELNIISDRILMATQVLQKEAMISIYIFVLLFVYKITMQKINEKVLFSVALFVAAIASNYAMIFSPEYPFRAMMGSCILILLAILVLCEDIVFSNKVVLMTIVVGLFTTYLSFQFLYATIDIGTSFHRFQSREETLVYMRDVEGKKNLVLTPIVGEHEYCAYYQYKDLNSDSEYWLNKDMAKYYNLDSLTASY